MASFMPASVFAATLVATSFAVGKSLMRLNSGFVSQEEKAFEGKGQLSSWSFWQLLIGMAGFIVFPQVLMSSLMLPGHGAAGLAAFVALSVYFLYQVCPGNSIEYHYFIHLTALPYTYHNYTYHY